MEIQVLNGLVKHNDRLNVNAASYSTHPQSSHILIVLANDSSTYEMLFESSSWLTPICGLPFKVTLPSRIPTSYSILVNRVPREWHVDSVRPLITQRYLSIVQVARIFRDGQPINRIRVDFRSNDDVQKILQCSQISIDAAAVSSSITKQTTIPTSQTATSAKKVMNTIEIVQMLWNAPIATPNTWLVHRNVQWRFAIVERRDNSKKSREKLINSNHPPISLLLLVRQATSINLRSSSMRSKKKSGAPKKFSSTESRDSRRNVMQFMSNKLRCGRRLKLRSFPTCRQCQSCSLMFASNWLRRKSSYWQISSKQKAIVFDTHLQLLRCHSLLRLSHAVSLLLIRERSANAHLLSLLFRLNELRCERILPFEWNWNTINNYWRRRSLAYIIED